MKNKVLQMLKLTLVFWLTTAITTAYAQGNCSELFFSEYIEGSSLNKGLEIYNPSMNTIDLSNYSVKIFANGSSSAAITIPLTGMLAGDSVFVLTHSGATAALKDSADLTSGALTFNGDDAVALVNASDTVDVIGIIGTDPGSAWTGSGLSTVNQTIVRNSSVQIGIGNDSTNFDPSTEFTSLGLNDFSNIGVHTSSCPRCINDTTQLSDAVCVGESYTFNGESLTSSGVYYDTLQNIGGCDSLIVLTFTINPLPTIIAGTSADTICAGTTVTLSGQGGTAYIWDNGVNDGVTFSPSATLMYTVVGQDANGCLGIDSTQVVVESPLNSEITISTTDSVLCEGEGTSFSSIVSNAGTNFSIQWKRNGNNVGTGLASYTSQSSSTNNGDIISAELTTTGVCGVSLLSNTITLTVSAIDSISIADTICTGENVVLGSQTLGTGGVYFETFTNVAGCDSVVKLTLIENLLPNVTASADSDSICNGSSVTLTAQGAINNTWSNGVVDGVAFMPSTTLDYIVTGTDANGCVNYDTVEVAVVSALVPTITISTPDSMLCTGEGTNFSSTVTNTGSNFSLQWKRNGNNVGTGLASYTSQSSNTNHGDVVSCEITTTGVCGTTIVSNLITLSVNTIDSVNIADTICTGGNVILGSQTLMTGGVYFETFTNIGGCDSVVKLTLIENQLPVVIANSTADTLCFGADVTLTGQGAMTYSWSNGVTDGVSFVPTVTVDYILTGIDANGCSNMDTVGVFVSNDTIPTIQIMTTDSILCTGEGTSFTSVVTNGGSGFSLQWMRNGNNVGTGLATYTSQAPSTNNGDIITCEISTVGTCGTEITSNSITITVNSTDTVNLNETICNGDSIVLGSQTLITSGSYSETFQNIGGCDSIVNLELTVNPVESSVIVETICEGTTYEFAGMSIEQAGIYYDSLQTTLGCDSIVTLELAVTPTERTSQTEFICSGDSFLFGGVQLDTSGTYLDTLASISGCDSVLTLNLIVGSTDTLQTSDIICGGDSVIFGSQVLNQSGVYTETFTSSGGCDSIVAMTLEVVASSSSQLSDTICANDSIEFGGQMIATSGIYYDTINNAAGCDSIIEFTLVVNAVLTDTLIQEICMGDSIAFAGVTYNQTGVYYDSLQTINGCDSIIVLDLTIAAPLDTTVINESICNGSSFVLGTQTITQAGTYTELFQSALGCDSIVTAIIGIGNSTDTAIVAEICQGEFYTFGTQVLTTTGSYSETFTNITGCDSVVNLTLSVKVNPIVSITLVGNDLISTQGDAYQWFFNGDTISGANDQSYTPTENGVYTVEMTAFNGCSDENNYTIQNVSISELANLNLLVAPNPSNGLFNVTAIKTFSYKVFNLLGEVVIANNVKNTVQNIDLTSEENGVYILEITTENNQLIIERLIKN